MARGLKIRFYTEGQTLVQEGPRSEKGEADSAKLEHTLGYTGGCSSGGGE